MQKAEITKPPIGLRPRWVVAEQRIEEIQAAMERYKANNAEIPQEWVSEYNELAVYLGKVNPQRYESGLWTIDLSCSCQCDCED